MIGRALLAAGAAVLASFSLAFVAPPARAGAPARVRLQLSSGTVVADGSKQVTFTVTNLSQEPLEQPVLGLAADAYDRRKVRFVLDEPECHRGRRVATECSLTPDPLPPGRTAKFSTTFAAVAGAAPGGAGRLRATFLHGTGPAEVTEFALRIDPGPNIDLYTFAEDVILDERGSGVLRTGFANQGDRPATHITLEVIAPRGAHFPIYRPGFENCDLSAQVILCSWDEQVLTRADGLRTTGILVNLDRGVQPGAILTGGTVNVIGGVARPAEAKRAAAPWPEAMTADPPRDIDLRDSLSRYQVVAFGPAPGGHGAGSDGGGRPVLPITGPAPALGAGALLLAAGALLMLLGRRREGVR